MLLRFGVENYLSLRDYQELSLVASSLSDEAADIYSIPEAGIKALPAIAIYGANASGKSNLLAALNTLRGCICNSHQKSGASRPKEWHFLLDSDKSDSPTTFDCDFVVGGSRYHYGFSTNCNEVVEEWLYAFPKKYKQTWFYRTKENGADDFYFGEKLRGQNRTVAELTRPDSLFLSVAASSNHKQLTKLYDYFAKDLSVHLGEWQSHPQKLTKYLEDGSARNRFVRFLRNADIGISDIAVEEEEADSSTKKLQNELSNVLTRYIPEFEPDTLSEAANKRVKLGHTTATGESIFLSWALESRGTQYILNLLGPAFEALDRGGVIAFDELETSTHPLVSRELVRLFCDRSTNPNGAQLIFATHDTNLLSAGVLRRDQIWFTQKGRDGATSVFPLTDIQTRKTDNLEKGYLQGRFGAVPYIDELLRSVVE